MIERDNTKNIVVQNYCTSNYFFLIQQMKAPFSENINYNKDCFSLINNVKQNVRLRKKKFLYGKHVQDI